MDSLPNRAILSSLIVVVLGVAATAIYQEDGYLPEFTSRIANISVPVGRDALFTCNVKGLGNFKVGWVKADSKAIQAIHDTVITHNARVEVSGDLTTTFNLHIANVQEEDSGQYMCQINTDPMTYQVATLDVMVPPEITDSTPDLELKQGSSAKLACHADGVPRPGISWMREHKRPIKAINKKGDTRKFEKYEGNVLVVPHVHPDDMGAYFCIAKNGVPPARSKRIFLYVQYPPRVDTQNEIMAYNYGQDVKLTCTVRAWPQPIILWNNTGGILFSNDRYEISSGNENNARRDESISTLLIKGATGAEEGAYACVASNSLGSHWNIVRIHMSATQPPPPPPSTSSASSPSSSATFTSSMPYSPFHGEDGEGEHQFAEHDQADGGRRRKRKRKKSRRRKDRQHGDGEREEGGHDAYVSAAGPDRRIVFPGIVSIFSGWGCSASLIQIAGIWLALITR